MDAELEAALADLIGTVEPVELPDDVPSETGQVAQTDDLVPPETVQELHPEVMPEVLRHGPIADLVDEVVGPPANVERPCPGCGVTQSIHPMVGFPICKPCDQRWGPEQTWDERMQLHNRTRTLDQILAARGRGTFGPVGDRLHVPALFARATPQVDVAEWAKRRVGTLVLHGPVGTGKSYQATGALRALIDGRDAHGYLVNCAGLSRMSRDEFRILTTAAALALDDLGARMSPTCLASAYELIEARHSAMLPLIVTTNITLEGIMAVDERIGSRLGAGKWIAMTGADRRLG